MFGIDPDAMPRGLQFDLAPKKKSGGMFAEGGAGRNIAGMIGDFLMAQAGMQPIYAPSMMQRQKQALEEAQYQRRQSDEEATWLKHQQWQRDNPMPGQPSEFETALTDSGTQPGTPEWTAAMKQRKDNMLDPVVMTPMGPMLRSQLLQGGGAGLLAAPGVTFTPIGGPSPGGSGGFLGLP